MKKSRLMIGILLAAVGLGTTACVSEKNPKPPVEETEGYIITFNANGHGTAPSNVSNVTALPSELPVLTETGWTFGGWYTDSACTIKATEGTTITANITLYAKWTESTTPQPSEAYNITYEINGHGTQPNSLTNVTALPNELPVLTETGWTFGGWYTDSACTIKATEGTTITANITLYAKWTESSTPQPSEAYNITYEINGHGTQPNSLTNVTALPAELPVLTENGWTFGGWYTDSACTIKATEGTTITANITLYAKWTESTTPQPSEAYNITYEINGHGTQPNSLTNVTALPNELPILTENGWTFGGWYTDSACTVKATEGTTITANITLYAKWTVEEKYSIAFVINEHGTVPEEIQNVMVIPENLPVLTADGYSFGGWYYDEGLTKPAHSGDVLSDHTTLYAKWYIKSQIEISKAEGYLESAYIEWKEAAGASDYNVYYKKTAEADTAFVALDKMLIREYPDKYRADILGLAAGDYTVMVAPVFDEEEYAGSYRNVVVAQQDRSGFGFSQNSTYKTSSGAYNDDGTLRTDAKVIYVTAANAKTVSCKIGDVDCVGLQTILDAKQKGVTTPLDIRIIGTLNLSDLDKISSSAEGLQIKGKNAYAEMNITIEGVGEDATIKGFGFLIRNCGNVELRNFAVMNQLDDAISIDTNNCNLWIHNLDLYYGQAGGDSDQAKGDGFIDIKKSQYCSVSYNHFYDSGKSCLIDASSASSGYSDYLTYHHNWFDHSDSRHPRVRNGKNIHVYNNYYDGIAKYGVGATTGSSTFVEANYFRNCKYPMLISNQGSDILADGIFSGEVGGMIKAYNNKIVGASSFITQKESSTGFDAIVVENKADSLSGYSCLSGGGTYSEFDTDSNIMYDYTPDDVEDVERIVTTYAGRINGGDFPWTFDNAIEDENYAVIPALKTAILNYKTTLVRVLGDTSSPSQGDSGNEGTENGSGNEGSEGGGEDNPSIAGAVIHNFTESGTTSSIFTITGSLSSSKGTQSYDGLVLTQCLKMESSTSITFSVSVEMTLTLVLGNSGTYASQTIKIDGVKYTSDASGVVTVELTVGSHTITKADTTNLFLLVLTE